MSAVDQSSNRAAHGSVESCTKNNSEHASTSTSTQESFNSSAQRVQTYLVDTSHSTPYESLNGRNINGSRPTHVDNVTAPQSVVRAAYNMRGELRRFDDAFNGRR